MVETSSAAVLREDSPHLSWFPAMIEFANSIRSFFALILKFVMQRVFDCLIVKSMSSAGTAQRLYLPVITRQDWVALLGMQ
jgi:hypothetical protein